jgi:glycolate dehydrogenase FAD-binding subunit
VSAIAEQLRSASGMGRRLRIRGAGTWLTAGRPVESDDTVSVADDRGIVEYVPGDLTLTARAGTRMSEIAAATAAHGQWLPLDPWGGDDGTIGATVSTATSGPHAYSMGLPRDAVLGLEIVSGNGDVIRAGGRVVKNVAGFDLTRLMVGSWGTLGVITEVTVRLRAIPHRTRTVAMTAAPMATQLSALAVSLRALPFTPLASELVNAPLLRRLGIDLDGDALLVRICGNERSMAGQLDQLRAPALGGGTLADVDDSVWGRLRTVETSGGAAWRWSRLPSAFGGTWTDAVAATRKLETAYMHGNPARGVVRVLATGAAGGGDDAALAAASSGFAGTTAIEILPSAAWARVSSAVAMDDVSRGIRRKFDPSGILNAGILGAHS